MPEQEAAPAREARQSLSSSANKGLFYGVAGYAILATLAAIYGLFIKSSDKLDSSHPLSAIPDNFGEFDPVSRKKVSYYKFPVDGELPANQKAALGGRIEIGQLEVEPVKVEFRPLKIFVENQQEKQEEPRRDALALVMKLRIKNRSNDLPIFPMDPAFTRRARVDDKQPPATRLMVGTQISFYGGGIEWPFPARVTRRYEEHQEKDSIPLKPGEEREYVVFTDTDQKIAKAVRESNETILWRVQVRRGLIEFKGKDVPVTAIIGVEFKSSDVKYTD